MATDFSVKFVINRVSATYQLQLTDASSSLTNPKGNFKVTYPNGEVIENNDFGSPDISALLGVHNGTIKFDVNNQVLTGQYTILYKMQADEGYSQVQKQFDFTWIEPDEDIQDDSDVVVPEVIFSDNTDYSAANFTPTITSRLLRAAYPTTSDLNGSNTSTATATLDTIDSGNYYEGDYVMDLDVTIDWSHDSLAYLSVQWVNELDETISIYRTLTGSELLTDINEFKDNVDTYKETNSSQFNLLSEDYRQIVVLYHHLTARVKGGFADGVEPIYRELIDRLDPYSVAPAYQSGPISALDLGLAVATATEISFTPYLTLSSTNVQLVIEELKDEVDLKEDAANKGAANGYAPLDSNSKVPVANLPNAIMEYQGTWNAATNTPTLANGAGNSDESIGDVYRCTVAGTVDFGAGNIEFNVSDYVILNAAKVWERSPNTPIEITNSADNRIITDNGDGSLNAEANLTFDGTNLDIANLRLAGNTISSTDAAGDIIFAPDTTGQVLFPVGAVSTPGMAFFGDTGTGIWSAGAGNMSFSISGSRVMRAAAAGLYIDGSIREGVAGRILIDASTDMALLRSMRLEERADHQLTPVASYGEIWLRNDTPNVLMFTDDAGTDWVVSGGSGSSQGVSGIINFADGSGGWSPSSLTLGANTITNSTGAVGIETVQILSNTIQTTLTTPLNFATTGTATGSFGFSGNTLTSGGTNDYGIELTQTLNDSGAAGGSDIYRAVKVNITETNTTGWNNVYLMDLQVGGTSHLQVGNDGTMNLSGATATARGISIQTAGSDRWTIEVDGTAESGSDAGSNLRIIGHNDSGTPFAGSIGDHWVDIERSTGNVIIGQGNLSVNGSVYINEKANADGDTAGLGQVWVKNDTPNTLYFTDDAGTDWLLNIDYAETGTFTPSIAFGGGSTGITYTTQTGRYTKIGNRYLVDLEIFLSNKGSSTGSATIEGLPANNNIGVAASGSVGRIVNFGSGVNTIMGLMANGGNSIALRTESGAGGSSTLSDTDFNNTSRFFMSITFET